MATRNALNTQNPIEVAKGGSGLASATAYAVLCGGTTATAALQSIASVGTSGQLLTSNGAGALPTFQTLLASATSWTPALSFGGGSTGITYTTQTGWYFNLGALYVIRCEIVLSNKGSSTGAALITGLPALPANPTPLIYYGENNTFTGFLVALISTPSGGIRLSNQRSATTAVNLTDAEMTNTSAIYISGVYST